MKKSIKNLWNAWKIFKEIKKHPAIFKVMDNIFKFVELTHEQQKPMAANIGLLNIADGTKIEDFVSLWAGIGDCNPIERARELKLQNTELKRLLKLVNDGILTQDTKEQIEVALKIFD